MRQIPATMATQHPDNSNAPYWERDGNGFVSIYEELEECFSCYQDLGVDEFMWDWEGKYADEAVIDKLFAQYYNFFKKHQLGRDKFLTFRIPNVSHEKGYNLIRALTVILTSEDFAYDLKFHTPPLFEVILPMVEHASQLIHVQSSFQKLARFKCEVFNHTVCKNKDFLEIIPLIEGVEHQMNVRQLLDSYVQEYRKNFNKLPLYIRPFLARSDPALVSGVVANVLANKIALSEIAKFSVETKIATFPIIGAGSLIFRGGLSPDHIADFVKQYAGVKTVTIQSAFRYDYPLSKVKKAIKDLRLGLKRGEAKQISEQSTAILRKIVNKFTKNYQLTLQKIIKDVDKIFAAVPKRRERKLHIGFLSYGRKMGKFKLPRAISFTAAFYSLGVPPEFIGVGRALALLKSEERKLLAEHYFNFQGELEQAGYYLNKDNLKILAKKNSGWGLIEEDIKYLEDYFKIEFGPRSNEHWLHKNLTANALLLKDNQSALSKLITETGKLRKSLG